MKRLLVAFAALAVIAAACSDPEVSGRGEIGEVHFDREPIIFIEGQLVAVDLDGDGKESITIDARESTDFDGTITDYQYNRGLDVVGVAPVFTGDFDVGEHVITLRITDDDGLTDHQAIVVRVLVPYERSSETSPEIELFGQGFVAEMAPTTNQRWFNVAGNVTDAAGVLELNWSLNGGPDQPLTLGPNDRRLVHDGDFNIDILRATLIGGTNTIEITAVNRLGDRTTALVRVENEEIASPQFPIEIDWTEQGIGGLVEIVDGGWIIDEDAGKAVIGPEYSGYDRLLSIGDTEWRDFDVTASVIVDGVNQVISPHSTARGFGFLMRWNGHNDSVAPGSQPQAGFYPDRGQNDTPFGAFVYYTFQPIGNALVMRNHRDEAVESERIQVDFGVEYNLRAQVQTVTVGAVYRSKMWAADEDEPAEWDVAYVAGSGSDYEPPSGSLVLVSHETETRWGPVTIRAVREDEVLSNAQVSALAAGQL